MLTFRCKILSFISPRLETIEDCIGSCILPWLGGMMSDQRACPLEQDFCEAASRELDVLEGNNSSDEECRRACAVILSAIGGFLNKWSELNDELNSDYGDQEGTSDNFPLLLLREVASKVVREVGPGDMLFRTSWLSILRRSPTKSAPVLNFLLEFLPCAFLPSQDEKIDVKTELLSTLDFVLEKDSKALTPILDCLQRMIQTRRIEKRAVFRFIINHVSKAQERGIGRVFKSLLDLGSDDGDLSVTVRAIRKRGSSETGALFVAYAISGTCQGAQQLEVFDEYLGIVEEECDLGETEGFLCCVDVLVLLLHRHNPKVRPAVEHVFDRMVTNGAINKRALSSIVRLANLYEPGGLLDRENGAFRGRQSLHDDLVWLLVLLCLGPIRSPKMVSSEKVLPLAKDFGVDLLLLSDQDGKHRTISALLQLDEELQSTMKNAMTNHPRMSKVESSSSTPSGVELSALFRIQTVIFMMLDLAAEKIPDVLRHHMKGVSRSLTEGYMGNLAVESACSVFVRVGSHTRNHSREKDFIGSSSDPFFVARALLFSEKRDDASPLSTSQEVSVEECVRGLILASKMVSSGHLNPTHVSILWQSVRLLLLPPTNRLPHPRRGNIGLRSLRSFCAWQEINEDSAALLNPGILATVTSILVTSRVVQYTNTSKKLPPRNSTILCYNGRPRCFEDDGSEQRKSPKMLFSFDSLQSDINFCRPINWELSTVFLFDLIDTYLRLGRTRSKGKWIARAWVEAPFAFPLIDISDLRATNARQHRIVNLMEGMLSGFDTSTDFVTIKGSSDKEFGEMLKNVKTKSERDEIVQRFLRSAMAFCLGLALSASILQNTFEHYAVVLEDQEKTRFSQERGQATRLMQYQLAKIYDMAGKCRILETIFRGILNANLRTKRRQKKSNRGWPIIGLQFANMDIHTDIRTATEQLNLILSSFTSSDEFLKPKVLWYCLADPSQDTLLIKDFEKYFNGDNAPTMEFEDHYGTIFWLRLNVLQHLTRHLQRFSERNRNDCPLTPTRILAKELAGMHPFYAQCLRLAAFFLSKLPGVLSSGVDKIRAKRLTLLTAAYFRLLLVSMEICLDIHCGDTLQLKVKPQLLGLGQFCGLYRCIMGAERPLTDAITMDNDHAQDPISLKSTINSFRRHLTCCKDTTILTEMLETLSVLSLRSQQDEAVLEMVRISWSALHSKFSDDWAVPGTAIPCALVEALKRFSPGAMLNTNPKTRKDAAIRETVLKTAFRKSKVQDNHSFLVQGILRHWGFLVLTEHISQSSADHLHQLYANLESFLSEAHESIAPKPRTQKDEYLSGEDNEYFPPKSARPTQPITVFPESAIPCLNQRSFVAYFQTLLDITVSSCALFRINDQADWRDSINGPYRELTKLVETFGSLVDLYRKRIHVFPHQCLPCVLNACRSMLNMALYQSTQCIEWRSSQPVLTVEQIEAQAFDPASVQLLAHVFDAFGIYVVGTLDSLCGSIDSLGSSTAHADHGANLGLSQKQKVKALRSKVHQIFSYLEKFAAEHKLPPPRQSLLGATHCQPTTKRRRIEIGGFFQFEESTGESVDNKTIQVQSNLFPNAVKHSLAQAGLGDEAISSELTWEEGSSEDDESFGADGDWGRESEEENEIRINAVV